MSDDKLNDLTLATARFVASAPSMLADLEALVQKRAEALGEIAALKHEFDEWSKKVEAKRQEHDNVEASLKVIKEEKAEIAGRITSALMKAA